MGHLRSVAPLSAAFDVKGGAMSHPSSAAALDELADELNRDGICVVKNLFDAKVLAEWRRCFDREFERRRNAPGGLAPRGPGRFYFTLPWQPPFSDEQVFANPTVLGVLNRVFAQEYVVVQIAVDTPVLGSEFQKIHRDHRPLFTEDLVTPLYALTLNFPLCDVDNQNGPLEIVRGTHRLSRDEGLAGLERGELSVESVRMKLGDGLIRTPLALHRGTPNRTPDPRPMVAVGYVMHWLHTPQVEVNVPRAAYQALAPELRALLRCNVVEALPAEPSESYVEFQY